MGFSLTTTQSVAVFQDKHPRTLRPAIRPSELLLRTHSLQTRHGPKFVQMDMGLSKSFKLTETMKLDFKATAQNALNHPSFDCVRGDVSSGTFGAAQCLAQNPSGTTLGAPTSRIMSLGLRLAF